MKRSQLYAKVWATPLSRLSTELGVSDVGLAKACRRHAIPTPPRGHWAKLAAGQQPQQTPLPSAGTDDPVIKLAQAGEGEGKPNPPQLRSGKAARASSVPAVLESPHRLTSATRKFFEEVQADLRKAEARSRRRNSEPSLGYLPKERVTCGRYSSGGPGRLYVVASLAQVDWILRFHDTLIKGLVDDGWRIDSEEGQSNKGVRIRKDGETFHLAMLEGYEKVPLRESATPLWRKDYRPMNDYTIRVHAVYVSEQRWRGSRERLARLLPSVLMQIGDLPARESSRRAVVDAQREREQAERAIAESERKRRYEAERRVFETKEARRMLFEQALQLANAQAQHEQLARFIQLAEACPIAGDRSAARDAWLAVVREYAERTDPLKAWMALLDQASRDQERPLWWDPKMTTLG